VEAATAALGVAGEKARDGRRTGRMADMGDLKGKREKFYFL
jgi:hypothetical protein